MSGLLAQRQPGCLTFARHPTNKRAAVKAATVHLVITVMSIVASLKLTDKQTG